MRWKRDKTGEVDALDLAAIWPGCAPIAGLCLPPVESSGPAEQTIPDEGEGHGIW